VEEPSWVVVNDWLPVRVMLAFPSLLVVACPEPVSGMMMGAESLSLSAAMSTGEKAIAMARMGAVFILKKLSVINGYRLI